MKVVCDNCRAVYKVPDTKLTKPVNKATCRNCGHRMLIPKPKPDADPEERTLVTAVPPTPAPAQPRSDGPATTPIEDEPEQTVPGGPPEPAPWSDDNNAPLPQRKGAVGVPSMATTVTAASPVSAEQRGAQYPQTPNEPPLEPVHDPSSDLLLAMLGSVTALFGSLLLATQPWVADQGMRIAVMGVGLLFTIGGCSTTLLVLFTGGRGTRPASTLLSVALSGVLAILASTAAAGGSYAAMILLQDAEGISFDVPTLAAVQEELPDEAEEDEEEADAEDAEDAEEDDTDAPDEGEGEEGAEGDEAEEDDAVADAVEAEEAPAPSSGTASTTPNTPAPQPTPVPTSAPSPVPTSAPAPAPRPAPTPPPAPAPSNSGVAMDVIQVMLYNNLGVKKCFVPLMKAGTMPSRTDVRFTIQPTGSVSDARVVSPSNLASGEFGACMSGAIKQVSFPPFSGGPQSVTFPFVMGG